MSAAPTSGFETWVSPERGAAPVSGLEWLEAQRRHALASVHAQGVPSSKQEAWRYTNLKRLVEQGFAPAAEASGELTLGDLDGVLLPEIDGYRVVMVNGRFSPALSRLDDLPKGVRIDGLRAILDTHPDLLRDHLNQSIGAQPPLFTALNLVGLDDGLVVLLEPGAVLERPIEMIHVSVELDVPRVAQPRHLIVLGEAAQAVLIERYVSLGQVLYCTNSVVEVSLSSDAVLKHDRVQAESPNAFHISGVYLSQARGSRYEGVNIGMGAVWARTDLFVRFLGEHAECDLRGLYLAGDQQLMDYHLDVDHAVPSCTSHETFKGILYGRGRAVFDGRVLVAEGAQKTDAAMSNKNLILSENAEVDTKPQLEIRADDVKCSHGTTVGQLEPEMLFYLRSRGISTAQARRMLCLGFAGEIIEGLHSEALRERVWDQVGARLESAPIDGS